MQKELDLIELRLAAPPLTAEEESGLAGWIAQKFTYPFRVRSAYVDDLPRTTAGKFEDFFCAR